MTEDQLEDLLTRQGQSWRAVQPAAPSLTSMTTAPPARQPRARWLLPALVAAALLAPVIGTVTLLRAHHRAPAVNLGAAPVVVPWADLPAPVAPRPDQLATRAGVDGQPPAGTKSCASGDFAATSDSATPTDAGPAAGGSGRYTLTVQQVSAQPCAIGNSTPTLNILDAAGRSLGVGGSGLLIGYPGYTLLYPGDVLTVPARICGAGIASVELRLASTPEAPRTIGQPGSAGSTVSIPFHQKSTCANGASSTSHQRVAAGGSLSSLVPGFSAPGRVRSGQRLDYSVTLTNPSATAVPLEPCPGYRQALIDTLELPDPRGVSSTGQLNCAAAPASVAAHSSITFQLRLSTEGVPTGDRQLVWDWLGSTSTDAEGYAQFRTVTLY